jgi:UDP-3-O-[3-hydroxymyristoyl] glucosamine N-acyltransferase
LIVVGQDMDEPGAGLRLGDLAERAGVELRGDPDLRVDRVATLEQAGPGAVAFLTSGRYRRYLKATTATAVVLSPDDLGDCPTAALVTANPHLAFARIAGYLNPPAALSAGIHTTAFVHPEAVLDDGVAVGPQAVVMRGAKLGARVQVAAGGFVGEGAEIGADSQLGVNVTVAERVVVGQRAVLHPGAVLGSDGFGFANDRGSWVKVPQLGSVRIGDDVEIGANTTIDRGALGDTVIEDGVKLDNLVHIAHNVRIGAHTVMAACCGVAGSTSIGKHCAFAGMVGIAGHLTITDGVVVTGMTTVTRSISEPGTYSGGTQMAPNQVWRKSAVRFNQLDDMYRRLRELESEVAELRAQQTKE